MQQTLISQAPSAQCRSPPPHTTPAVPNTATPQGTTKQRGSKQNISPREKALKDGTEGRVLSWRDGQRKKQNPKRNQQSEATHLLHDASKTKTPAMP
jgi:hypothetical protein